MYCSPMRCEYKGGNDFLSTYNCSSWTKSYNSSLEWLFKNLRKVLGIGSDWNLLLYLIYIFVEQMFHKFFHHIIIIINNSIIIIIIITSVKSSAAFVEQMPRKLPVLTNFYNLNHEDSTSPSSPTFVFVIVFAVLQFA